MFRLTADQLLAGITRGMALGSATLVLLIAAFLLHESWPALADGHWRRFFNSPGWFPSSNELNLWPMLAATMLAMLGALLLAIPIGIASALFIVFLAPRRLAASYRRLIILLAGIPSVVYGLWGLTVLVPIITQWQPPGASLLAAILILALMILPTIVLTSDAALAAVPHDWLQGGHALGLTRKSVLLGIALPAARSGILGGILLAAARALGETMAVLMVAGNVVQLPHSLFDPVRVLTANMALEMAYATGTHRASLFVSALLLLLLVTLLAWAAHRVSPTQEVTRG